MPPKSKVTREEIITQALELVRQGGEVALNARGIAGALGCSTQPIFSHFRSMEELKVAVVAAAWEWYNRMVQREMDTGTYPPYKAYGVAYIRFATEERELFRLLYMRDRTGETPMGEEELEPVFRLLEETCGVDRDTARLLHLEMWTFVHGVATMAATGYYTVERELASRMTSDVYAGLIARHTAKEE